MMDWIFRDIEKWLTGKWHDLWDAFVTPVLPYLILIEWIAAFVVLFALLAFVRTFLPFSWYDKARAVVLAMAGAFLAGGIVMWRQLAKLRPKPKVPGRVGR